jgi:hypothetical protein
LVRTQPLYKLLLSRRAVLQAVDECRRDEAGFLERYGYGEAETYFMRHGGRPYASKAIVGVAYGYQYPELGPLKNGQFDGGKGGAATHLARLGFDVDGISLRPEDWTLIEVEAVVSEYFRIYSAQIAGSYVRKRDLAQAVAAVSTRSESAVSQKFSNISAILAEAELPLIKGFTPLGNKQTLLSAVVYDWVRDYPDVFDRSLASVQTPLVDLLGVEVEPPSIIKVSRAKKERKAARVDFAARDERNRQLGRAGEQWALQVLRLELTAAGRPDLADRIVWVSDTHGDGLGYDIASFSRDGSPQFVEVKTTNGGQAAPFIVTANEVRASEEEAGYVLMRVFSFSQNPRFYRLHGSLTQSCALTPLAFSALPRAEDDDLLDHS